MRLSHFQQDSHMRGFWKKLTQASMTSKQIQIYNSVTRSLFPTALNVLFLMQKNLRMTHGVYAMSLWCKSCHAEKSWIPQHTVLALCVCACVFLCVCVLVCARACVIKPASWCFQLSMDHNEELIWIAVIHKPAPVHMVSLGWRVGEKKHLILYLLGFCIRRRTCARVHSMHCAGVCALLCESFFSCMVTHEHITFRNSGRETCEDLEQWLSPCRKVE